MRLKVKSKFVNIHAFSFNAKKGQCLPTFQEVIVKTVYFLYIIPVAKYIVYNYYTDNMSTIRKDYIRVKI